MLRATESSDVENVRGQKYEEGHIKDGAACAFFLETPAPHRP